MGEVSARERVGGWLLAGSAMFFYGSRSVAAGKRARRTMRASEFLAWQLADAEDDSDGGAVGF
jgi:hypothetical protein